jgi:hypothetical protein
MLVSCLPYSSTPKMKAPCSPEMSVDFQWTTWHYVPEDRTLLHIFSFCTKMWLFVIMFVLCRILPLRKQYKMLYLSLVLKILVRYCHTIGWLWTGFGLVIGFIALLQFRITSNYGTIADSHTLQFTTAGTVFSVCPVFTGCHLVTAHNVIDLQAHLI